MKKALRAPIAAILLCLSLFVSGCAPSQPHGNPDERLAKAAELAKTKPADALTEYNNIRNAFAKENPEKAADALLQGALLAADPVRYATPQVKGYNPASPTPAQVAEFDAKASEGEYKAHDAYKSLFNQFPDTKAAQTARDQKLKEGVDARIDKRNSVHLSYRIMDALVALTGRIPSFSYWFALFLLAAFIKVVTLPLMLKSLKGQREMQRMQPIIKALQEKHKDKPAEFQEKMWAAYKEHGVSPFATCIPLLIQMPFLFLMFTLVRVYEIHMGNGTFLWIGSPISHQHPYVLATNLAQFDVILLTIYVGTNYLTMKLTPSTDPAMAAQQRQMSLMMTVFVAYMFWVSRWSAAFLFYWLVQNIFTAWQNYTYIYKPNKSHAVTPDGSVLDVPSKPVGGDSASGPKNGGGSNPATTTPPAPRPRPRNKRRR